MCGNKKPKPSKTALNFCQIVVKVILLTNRGPALKLWQYIKPRHNAALARTPSSAPFISSFLIVTKKPWYYLTLRDLSEFVFVHCNQWWFMRINQSACTPHFAVKAKQQKSPIVTVLILFLIHICIILTFPNTCLHNSRIIAAGLNWKA